MNRSRILKLNFLSKVTFLTLLLLGLWSVVSGPWSSAALALEPSISASVDKDTLSLDDTLTLSVLIRGGTMLTSPDIPSQGNFDVVGRSSGNSIEIINGMMSSTMNFEYILSPRSTGDFSIGPIKVYVEGHEFSTGPLQVKVVESRVPRAYIPTQPSGMPGPPPGYPGPAPWPPAPEERNPSPPSGERYQDTFLTAETDRKEAYVGQQILYTFRLYSAVSVQNAQLTLPEFKDFITEELAKERKYQVELGGRTYAVNEWRMALFPTKAGLLKTGEVKVQGSVPVSLGQGSFDDPFFRGFAVSLRPKNFTAPNIDLQVKELPPAPEDFTGLVGQFGISSKLSKESLNLGETADLKVEISGKGNIAEAVLPKLTELPNFKVYPGKPEVQLQRSIQGLQGKKIFTYALVGDRPGTANIPPLSLSYFDPEKGVYEKLDTPPMSVHVLGSTVNEKLVTAGIKSTPGDAEKTKTGFDLHPLKAPAVLLYSEVMPPWEKSLALALLTLPPLGWMGLFMVQRQRAQALAHADDRKRSRAFKKAKGSLTKLPLGKEGENFATVSLVIKEYLGDRFLVKGSALIPNEIEALLVQKRVPTETVRRMVYLLEQLDLWKYGGVTGDLPPEKALKQEVLDLLREVEKA